MDETPSEPANAADLADPAPAEPETASPVKSRRIGLKLAIVASFLAMVTLAVAAGIFMMNGSGSSGSSPTLVAKASAPATKAAPPTAPAVAKKTPPPATTPPGPPQPPDVIFKRASPAVVRVDVHGALSYQGSGFFISADGIVATNYHMIKDASAAEVVTTDGARYKVTGMIATDRPGDLVLLQVAGKDFPTLELGGKELPTVGSKAYAIGHPKGLSNTLSDGLVSGHRELEEGLVMIQTTAPISPGSSGGPLLSPDGKVVGVTTASITGGQNLNLASPVSRLSKLLAERGSLRPLPGPNAEVNLRWNLKLGDSFYVEKVERYLETLAGKRLQSSRWQHVDLALLQVKVKEINDEGTILEVVIEDLKRKKDGGEPNPLASLLPKAVGTVVTVMLSRGHGILKTDGLQEMIKKLGDAGDGPTQKELANFGVEHMVNGALQEAFHVGAPSATRGDVWRRKGSIRLGSLGTVNYTRVYCFEGPDRDGDKITIKGEYKYELPKGGDAQDGGIRALGGEVKVEESKGETIFDSKARRLIHTEYSSRVRATLQGKVDLDDTVIDVLLETGGSVRVFSKRPASAPPKK